MPWDEWAAELDRLAGDAYGPRGAIAECGESGWREMFDHGYSPSDAFEEDRSYWEE